jgi:hypothetical protein
MRHANTPCGYCKSVASIGFSRPRPEKPWKRPVLLVVSCVSMLCFAGAIAYFLPELPHPLLFAVLLMFIAISLFGLAVAVKGCDACVSRLLGSL